MNFRNDIIPNHYFIITRINIMSQFMSFDKKCSDILEGHCFLSQPAAFNS